MNNQTATQLFTSLSSPIRLDIYRLLMRKGSAGMVSGEIAAAVGLPPTNTSFHLKAMTQAGLLSSGQEGRYQRYRAEMSVMHDLITYLTDECCIDADDQLSDIVGGVCVTRSHPVNNAGITPTGN